MNSQGTIPGTIPQSDLLAEASPSSLTDLLSRDPESRSRTDRDAAVRALRAQRERMEKLELEGKTPSGRAKVTKGSSSTTRSATDLDL